MSLRLRLFLLLGGLILLLLIGQWWLVRSLTRDLAVEAGVLAVDVSDSVLHVLELAGHDAGHEVGHGHVGAERETLFVGASGHAGDEDGHEERVRVEVRPEVRRKVRIEGHAELVPDGSLLSWNEAGEGQVHKRILRLPPRSGEEGDSRQIHLSIEAGDVDVMSVEGEGLVRRVPIPRGGLDERLEGFSQRLLLGSLLLFGVGLGVAAAVAYRVSTPLRDLGAAARRVGAGELGAQAPEPRDPEVGLAVRSFNRMSSRLQTLDRDARTMRARQHLAELGEVARGLAHSLRNPLNTLGLSVEELAGRASEDDPSAQRIAEVARREIRRVDHSIRNLLVLAAENNGGGSAEAVALEPLVQDVALEAMQDGRARVRLEAEPGSSEEALRVVGIAPELRAVIQALVINAVEASPPGGEVTVRLLASENRGARLEIDDEGPGLAPEVRERLFQPHVSTKASGSGMGLFLAHRIVTDRYGGSLEILDVQPTGTRAVLTIHDREDSDGAPGAADV